MSLLDFSMLINKSLKIQKIYKRIYTGRRSKKFFWIVSYLVPTVGRKTDPLLSYFSDVHKDHSISQIFELQ